MELNGIANLKILIEQLRHSYYCIETSQHPIVKQILKEEIDSIDKQIKYLHAYLQEVGHHVQTLEYKLDFKNEKFQQLPYWHEIKAKVDKNG